MNLDAILNAVSIPLEAGDLTFQLRPFPNLRVLEWNRTQKSIPKDAPDDEVIAKSEEMQKAQLEVIADHMKACLVKGDAKKVTTKWVGESLPFPVLKDLALFFVHNTKPKWAGESEEGESGN